MKGLTVGKSTVLVGWDFVPRGTIRALSDVNPGPRVEQAALATKLCPHTDTLVILHVLSLMKGV